MHTSILRRQAAFTLVELSVVIVCVVLVVSFLILPAIQKPRGDGARVRCINNLKNIGLACRIYATDNNSLYPWHQSDGKWLSSTPTNYAPWPGIPLTPAQGVAANFAVLSNELNTVKILRCSSDTKRFLLQTNSFAFLMAPAQTAVRDRAISYFLGVSATEEQPQSILGGDRNLAGGPFGSDTNTSPSVVALRVPASVATGTNGLNSVGWTKEIHQYAGNVLLGDGSVQQVTSGRMRDQVRDAALGSGTNLDFIFPAN